MAPFSRKENELNFPHLKDTPFPDLGTADVYQFQNTFDYTRWNEDTKIKLVNVIWNSDYSDVVKFDTDAKRDKYFDTIEDYYAIELAQAARIVPENYVKLPIPYDVMARYNYLFIDMPIATSATQKIDYETTFGLRRWYFFIDSITYLSPNSTQVFLSLDVWTNFQNDVEINYMMLERGHAPVYASDTDKYLQNPIANNQYLLAPDVNFDNASITRSSDYIPFGNGTKYVCLASTCAPGLVSTLGVVTTDPNYNPTGNITYSDIDARYGHQLDVHGFTVGNGRNYSDAKTPAAVGESYNGLIPNNLTIWAIRGNDVYGEGTFFEDVTRLCPQFLNTIQACFVVDEKCLTFGETYSIAGHTIRQCKGSKRNLLTKQLEKSNFDYPKELQRFAKLYTSPYAVLEVTDNDGTTFTINIEETSTVQVKSVVSVAFPYIDYRVYLEGICGVGSKSYSWVDLRGHQTDEQISNSDWFKYCFDWDIPTFALYMDGETAYQLANWNRGVNMGIRNALVAYHNAMRSANTANANAIDAADTALANVNNSTETARTNAYNSADTGKTNADNSADTGKTNADASADTMYTNVDNTCTTEDANRIIQQGTNLRNVLVSNGFNHEIAEKSVTIGEANWWADMAVAARAIGIEGEAAITLMGTTALSNLGHGILSGIGSGFSMGGAQGAVVGGISGGIMGGVDSTISAQQQAVAITTKGEIWDAQNEQGVAKWDRNKDLAMDTVEGQNNANVEQLANTSTAIQNQMENNHALARGNAGRNRDTAKANATRTHDTTQINAANTQSTSKTNADNNYNTDRTNATNTRNVTVANSGYTRQVEELNAKENLENAANTAMASILDARNNKPISIGNTTGNPTQDYMQKRGVQLKVKTQSDSAIQQTGSMFARFGYALNQVWNVKKSGLKLMRHFTYWKATDIWVDDRQSSNNMVQNFITRMFLNGVTVWNNPNEIGRVDIYDN